MGPEVSQTTTDEPPTTGAAGQAAHDMVGLTGTILTASVTGTACAALALPRVGTAVQVAAGLMLLCVALPMALTTLSHHRRSMSVHTAARALFGLAALGALCVAAITGGPTGPAALIHVSVCMFGAQLLPRRDAVGVLPAFAGLLFAFATIHAAGLTWPVLVPALAAQIVGLVWLTGAFGSMLASDPAPWRPRIVVLEPTAHDLEAAWAAAGAAEATADTFRDLAVELGEATALAEATTRTKTAFLSHMSHEIRTPLNGVLGTAQLLQSSGLNEEQRAQVDTLQRCGKHLLRLVNDVLDLSKAEANAIVLEELAIRPARLLGDVAAMIRESADAKRVALELRVDPDVPELVRGDPVRLAQVLANLGSNAVKFTEDGRVTLAVSRRGEALHFCVSDTGIGIPPEKLATLFEAYTQADDSTSRRFGGTGLGLDISREIVRAMGSELQVASTEGLGSQFFFTAVLPPVYDEAPAYTDPFISDATEPGPTGLTAILADDNAVNLQVAAAMLKRCGVAHVILAHDGAEAVEAWRTEQPDVVFMDCEMPGMDGVMATRQIRAEETGDQRVPIVMLTAHVDPAILERARAAGADETLSKPLKLATLRRMLRLVAPTPLAPVS